jgi:hypothetical protein
VLLLGGALAVAGGLPFLLLPRSLWRSPLHDAADKEEHARDEDGHEPTAAAAAAGATPDSAAADGAHSSSSSKPGEMQSPFQQHQQQQQQDADKPNSSSSSSSKFSWWGRSLLHADWSLLMRLLVAADEGLREFCASSFLDTAVSGLIVVGLILGSVVLSVVLLVQVRPLYSCLLVFFSIAACLLPVGCFNSCLVAACLAAGGSR